MDYYVMQNLSSAVGNLVGPGTVRERLRGATIGLLKLQHKPFDDTRDRDRYTAIMEKLAPSDDVEDALATMDDDEAGALSREILKLYESCLVAEARDDVLAEMLRQDAREAD